MSVAILSSIIFKAVFILLSVFVAGFIIGAFFKTMAFWIFIIESFLLKISNSFDYSFFSLTTLIVIFGFILFNVGLYYGDEKLVDE